MSAKTFLGSAPDNQLSLTNCVFISLDDAARFSLKPGTATYVSVKGYVFTAVPNDKIAPGVIGLNAIQRRTAQLSQSESVEVSTYVPPPNNIHLNQVQLEVGFINPKANKPIELEAEEFSNLFKKKFIQQIFTVSQSLFIDYNGSNLLLKVASVEAVDMSYFAKRDTDPDAKAPTNNSTRGILIQHTNISLVKAADSSIRIKGNRTQGRNIFNPGFNFENLGIGGLDKEFTDIFRRAFAARIFPPDVVTKLGITHVRGMLLHGPPGTGKTLIARQIGKMLQAREPKIVNGPEILNKYVGASEENIRALFADAESDQQERGDESDLHIIIFDEIDAICKSRGSNRDGTGVHDSIVNQLLSKIDGVDSLNNILLIGMTNRKDMIDEALLRPGRLEVHVEVGLPDEKGRQQIIRIHTKKMRDNDFLGNDFDLDALSRATKNYSGAEIEGLVKSATSFALNRKVDASNLGKQIDLKDLCVTMVDFEKALEEVKPAFGIATEDLESCLRGGMIDYGEEFQHLVSTGEMFVHQVRTSDRTPVMSILLEGAHGSGKTALAARLALDSEFPFVKLISPENYVGYSEAQKVASIAKVFDDAYKSKLSVIVLDNIERLIEYVSIGPRFSNLVLQGLMVLMKKSPPPGRRVLVIGTTSNRANLEPTEILQSFSAVMHVPLLSKETGTVQSFMSDPVHSLGHQVDSRLLASLPEKISVKKLLMLIELARDDDKKFIPTQFLSVALQFATGENH